MRVGWIGLGKLGLPCALALAEAGHEVVGYDAVEAVNKAIDTVDLASLPYVEPGVAELLGKVDSGQASFQVAFDLDEVVRDAEVVFVAVQTPHAPEFDGTRPVPRTTRDFEYGYLVQAVRQVVAASNRLQRNIVLVVVSTVLPGTTDRLIRPLLSPRVALVYSPQFIAMGTTLHDFAHPEFLLLGSDYPEAAGNVSDVFALVHDAPRVVCTVADAELTKVAYNTYISLKIVWANQLALICEAVGADADVVVGALELARDRVVSPAYMRPGMGDGGACHPRDLIALASLEARSGLPDFYLALAWMRDSHTQGLAERAIRWAKQAGLERIVLLGLSYKPGVPLTDGSPALLLQHILRQDWPPEQVFAYDPYRTEVVRENLDQPAVFVHSTAHEQFQKVKFPAGSVVIDPWGTLPQDSPGVVYVRPGRR